MKISGVTIIRNAVKNDYPVREAIESVLPAVDEMIVGVGDSEDDTLRLISAIKSDKIKIFHSTWDPEKRKGGEVLALETNKVLDRVSPESDWIFYIQADEVVHEDQLNPIREAAQLYLENKKIEGLVFRYLHFYGTYDYTGDSRRWYDKEVRMIRNDRQIRSFKDAQGFRKNGKKIRARLIDACIYHYGWVKSPGQMEKKLQDMGRYWNPEKTKGENDNSGVFDFSDFDSLKKFTGTHPSVMNKRIAEKNWQIELDLSRKKFSWKDRLLYWIEQKTGRRLFEFRNYKMV